jgi:CelD/BcsL family acetyltransferase involved in cellulose biosynthesis
VSTVDRLLELGDEWRDLEARTPTVSIYQSWDWIEPWARTHLPGESFRLLLLRRGSRLVAAAPLLIDSGSLTLRHTPSEFLVAEEHSVSVAALLEHLARRHGRWRLALKNCPAESATTKALCGELGRRGIRGWIRSGFATCLVRLDGSWEAYLRSRSSHVRREWRRKRKRFETAGRTELVTATSVEDCDRVFNDVVDVERRSWKGREGLSLASDDRDRRLHYEAARRAAARGCLRLSVLYLDSLPVAHFLGIVWRRQLLGLRTAFDERLTSLSPGLIVVLHALEGAFAARLDLVDFLAGDGRWKAEMATDERPLMHVCAFPAYRASCLGCVFARSRLGPALRRWAPFALLLRRRAAGGPAPRRR